MAEVAGSNPASPTTWICPSTAENARIGAGRCSKSSCTVKYTPVSALRPSPMRTLSAALEQIQEPGRVGALALLEGGFRGAFPGLDPGAVPEFDALKKRWEAVGSIAGLARWEKVPPLRRRAVQAEGGRFSWSGRSARLEPSYVFEFPMCRQGRLRRLARSLSRT